MIAVPRLMEKKDWMRTIANVGSTDRVWFQDVSSRSGTIPLEVPEAGNYRIVLLKMGNTAEIVEAKKPCVRDFIGYGRKFNPVYRSTAEIMKELREGEKE